jgi:hypothetical protein
MGVLISITEVLKMKKRFVVLAVLIVGAQAFLGALDNEMWLLIEDAMYDSAIKVLTSARESNSTEKVTVTGMYGIESTYVKILTYEMVEVKYTTMQDDDSDAVVVGFLDTMRARHGRASIGTTGIMLSFTWASFDSWYSVAGIANKVSENGLLTAEIGYVCSAEALAESLKNPRRR